jgi:FkbM family methyltransferase
MAKSIAQFLLWPKEGRTGFMLDALKSFTKRAMAKTPYRLVRTPQNRFQAIEECLRHLKGLGYTPRIIVDGGAHLGDFSMLAHSIFPEAAIHMIEPQPACQAELTALAGNRGWQLHSVALVSDGEAGKPVIMAAGSEPSTGAYIVPPADKVAANILVDTSTLDRLFGSTVNGSDRALLKLDLQGYELAALQGAAQMLGSVEVVLAEVSFFAQAYEPSIAELVMYLAENDFELYDIAALSARARDDRLKQGDLLFVKKGSSLSIDTSWS